MGWIWVLIASVPDLCIPFTYIGKKKTKTFLRGTNFEYKFYSKANFTGRCESLIAFFVQPIHLSYLIATVKIMGIIRIIEPRCEKTGFLHMRKQRRRSAAQ